MRPSDDNIDAELPSIQINGSGSKNSSLAGSMFGGSYVERRPLMIAVAITIIVLIGFIIGTLFTMGILSGLIEIDPKAIKSVLKTLLGKH